MVAILSPSQQAWPGLYSSFYAFLFFSTPVAAATSTFSSAPTQSVGRVTATTYTKATHTLVTSGGKTTTIPVLPDYQHGCYFCPTSVGGLVLSGFTLPGVYPSHLPSGFTTSFPAITVNSAGDPTFQASTSSTKGSITTAKSTLSGFSASKSTQKSSVASSQSSSGQNAISSTPSAKSGVASTTSKSSQSSSKTSVISSSTKPSSSTSLASSNTLKSSQVSSTISSTKTTTTLLGASVKSSSSSSRLSSSSASSVSKLSSSTISSTSKASSSTINSANKVSSSTNEVTGKTSSSAVSQVSPGTNGATDKASSSLTASLSKTSSLSSGSLSEASPNSTNDISTVSSSLSNSISRSSTLTLSSSIQLSSSSTSSISSSAPKATASNPTVSSTANAKSVSSSSSSTSSLPIFTIFPTSPVATITQSSSIQTGSTTSETVSGQVTVFPVLPAYGTGPGLCWFCPHSGGGFVLSGFPKVGIYPTGNLPGFPNIIPQITIGLDLIPKFGPDPSASGKATATEDTKSSATSGEKETKTDDSKSSATSTGKETKTEDATSSTKSSTTSGSTSSECTQSTVSDCSIVTSFAKNADGSTTATQTITSCAARTACSAQGSTTKSATTSSATATACWKFDYSVGYDDSESDESLQKRNQYDPQGHRFLRRKIEQDTQYGKCALTADGAPAAITTPKYPAATTLQAHTGASWWYVPTTFRRTLAPVQTTGADGQPSMSTPTMCPVVTMTRFANLAALTKDPVITNADGVARTYMVGNAPNPTPYVNVDHVYEQKLLKNFLDMMLGSDSKEGEQVDCDDFNNFFMAKDSNHGNDYRLQVIMNEMPSLTHLDFAGLDARINTFKGSLFNPKLRDIPGPGSWANFEKRIDIANKIAAAVSFVNLPEIAEMFKKTNSRIYNAFLGVDALIAQGGCASPPKPKNNAGWADAYSSYMVSVISAQNTDINKHLKFTALGKNKAGRTTDSPEFLSGCDAFSSQYPEASWAFNTAALLDWSGGNVLNLAKRADEQVCSKTQTGSATSVSASATSTNSAASSSLSTDKSSSQSPSKTSSTSPSSSSSVSSAPAACSGNKVQGTCTQGPVPSATDASGIRAPVCNKVNSTGSPYVRINSTVAQAEASAFCEEIVRKKTVLSADNTAPFSETYWAMAEGNGNLTISVVFDAGSCPRANGTTATAPEQKIDFGTYGEKTCEANLYDTFSQMCAEDKGAQGYDPNYSILGGTWGMSCALWSMNGVKRT